MTKKLDADDTLSNPRATVAADVTLPPPEPPKWESSDRTIAAPAPDHDDEATTPSAKATANDDDATRLPLKHRGAPAALDDEETRVASNQRPPTANRARISRPQPVPDGPVTSLSFLRAPQLKVRTIALSVAALVAVLSLLAVQLNRAGPRPEDAKPLRALSAEEKAAAENRSGFKSLFDW